MIKYLLKRRYLKTLSQLELDLNRPKEPDRNHRYGGRSFYFFDFDDNVAYLPTSMYLFHKRNGRQIQISTAEWATYQHHVGIKGPYKDYKIIYNDVTGSYRRFRDEHFGLFQKKLLRKKQPFVEDLLKALRQPDLNWKGPSWDCFYHAVYNHRPISIITARGHGAETIKEGISYLVKHGFLPWEPNYMAIYPVNDITTKKALGDYKLEMTVPELKKAAIRASVEKALKLYGDNVPHRFGMSDDDKKNLAFIFDEMRRLKKELPQMSFFVINTNASSFIKKEVIIEQRRSSSATNKAHNQMDLFSVNPSPRPR